MNDPILSVEEVAALVALAGTTGGLWVSGKQHRRITVDMADSHEALRVRAENAERDRAWWTSPLAEEVRTLRAERDHLAAALRTVRGYFTIGGKPVDAAGVSACTEIDAALASGSDETKEAR